MGDQRDNETERIIEATEREARRIKSDLDANAASDALAAASVWRLVALAAFAFVASGSAHEFASAVTWLAIFAACSAGFHVFTWLVLRVWHRRVHGRA